MPSPFVMALLLKLTEPRLPTETVLAAKTTPSRSPPPPPEPVSEPWPITRMIPRQEVPASYLKLPVTNKSPYPVWLHPVRSKSPLTTIVNGLGLGLFIEEGKLDPLAGPLMTTSAFCVID